MQTTEMSFLQGVAVREQFPADWFFADLEYICTIIAKDSQRQNEVILSDDVSEACVVPQNYVLIVLISNGL